MKKYIILHLSLILLVFIACTDDQKQDDKNITFQRSDFKVRKSLSGKLNLTVLFYDLHKSNYSTPS